MKNWLGPCGRKRRLGRQQGSSIPAAAAVRDAVAVRVRRVGHRRRWRRRWRRHGQCLRQLHPVWLTHFPAGVARPRVQDQSSRLRPHPGVAAPRACRLSLRAQEQPTPLVPQAASGKERRFQVSPHLIFTHIYEYLGKLSNLGGFIRNAILKMAIP